MSVRLPSQKRFAPSRPKLGGRPGGPSVGPSKGNATFAQPRIPAATLAAKDNGTTAAVAGAASSGNPGSTEQDGNAIAGPSSRPFTGLDTESGVVPSPIPSSQILAVRRSMSPVKRSSGLPEESTSSKQPEEDTHSRSGQVLPPMNNATSPSTGMRSQPAPPVSPSARNASRSPVVTSRPPPSPSPRPSASPITFARPLPPVVASSSRLPSLSPAPSVRKAASPAPRIVPRISASPAPSNRQRSISRQPSLTPSIRSNGRPSLIAAAENRDSPLNIPPTAKERRKAEKQRIADEEDSQRGTPAPILVPGMPPTLSAAPDDRRLPSRSPSTALPRLHRPAPSPKQLLPIDRSDGKGGTASNAVIAQRLVNQVRGMRSSLSPGPSARAMSPLFLPEDNEDEDEDEDEADAQEDTGEEDDTSQSANKRRKTSGRKPKAPAKPRTQPQARRPVAPQKKRYKRDRSNKASRAEAEEEDKEEGGEEDEDEELNELEVGASDAGTDATGTSVKRKKASGKRKRTREPLFQPVNLDVVEAEEMIGEEVDEENLKMGEIATTRSGEGKVSARAKELSGHLREANQRNRTRLDDESRERYERRQVMRRQIRALRNAKREERRESVRENGGDPDEEVSADEENSETEFEVIPERLTPVSSPEPGGGPQVGEDGIEEEDYQAPPEGADPDATVEEDEGDDEVEEPEEVAYDPTAVQEGTDERHEEEEFDPDLAALGYSSRPAGAEGEEGGEYDDEENAETYEDLFAQLEDSRNAALRRNDEREVIEEEQTGRMPNNMSYMKKKSNERWSKEETEFFYQVLGETGENYTLMSFYFPSRSQKQLKNKGRKESLAHPDRVNEAIRARRPIDPEYLQKTVGYDPRGPTESADQLLEETRELPARWTREDTDRALADAQEEGEEGERVEETNYEDVAAGLTEVVDGEEGEAGEDEEMGEEEDKEEDGEEEEGDEEDFGAMEEE